MAGNERGSAGVLEDEQQRHWEDPSLARLRIAVVAAVAALALSAVGAIRTRAMMTTLKVTEAGSPGSRAES